MRKAFFAAAIAVLWVLMAAPAPGEAPKRVLTRFEMTRSTDLPARRYEVFLLGDEYYLSKHDGAAQQIGAETAEALRQIAEEHGVPGWDGFSGNDPYVLDGESFWLELAFSDGTAVYAAGTNSFPDGYYEAADAMEEVLNGVPYEERAAVFGTYRYEGAGFGGDFILTLSPDGTYTFYEGVLSSYIGGGEWNQSGALIYLSEENGLSLYNTFIPIRGALVFAAEDSDGFPHVTVPDGGRFILLDPEEAASYGIPPMVLTVGAEVPLESVRDFYWTESTSTYPPYYQRYRFYLEEDGPLFFHETREGGGFPQTEEDITSSGTVGLTAEDWVRFLLCVNGGSVQPREDRLEDGLSGPWTYLYWLGDRGIYQEFTFASPESESAFGELCEELRSRDPIGPEESE